MVAATAMQCDRDPNINRINVANTVDIIMKAHLDSELIIFGWMILGWYDSYGMVDYHRCIAKTIPGETIRILIKPE